MSRQEPSSHSCRICQRLVIDFGEKDDAWVERTLALRYDPNPSEKAKQGRQKFCDIMALRNPSRIHPLYIPPEDIIFDFSMGEVREEANDGCLLLQHLKRLYTYPADNTLLACEKQNSTFIVFKIEAGIAKKRVRIPGQAQRSLQMRYNCNLPGACFDALVAADTRASRDFSSRPFNITPSSEGSMVLMKGWLQNCLINHPTCQHPSSNFLPTRLISIPQPHGNQETVYLRNTKDQKAVPYAALSYCWGQQGQVTTSGVNLQSHLDGIVVKSLPQTIQDAIEIARNLAIPNLWIDSLCIIQDDPIDKATEIAQMPLVYSQAMLTIAASRSSNVHEGCLGDRFDLPYLAQIQLQYRCLDGTHETVTIFPRFDGDSSFTEPLDERAWALQERFLSSRLLEFGSLQTRWMCQLKANYISADGFRSILDESYDKLDHLSRTTLCLLRGDKITSTKPTEEFPTVPYELWRKLVERYCDRGLTLKSDRLPAISGLATRFADLFLDDQYCAGIWKSRLPRDLLWYIDPPYNPDSPDGIGEPSQGPSWSWGSASGTLAFGETMSQDSAFDIVDCHTETVEGGGLYGAVTAGTLTVSGRLQNATWYWDAVQEDLWHKAVLLIERGVDGNYLVEILPSSVRIDYPYIEVENNHAPAPVTLLTIQSSSFGKSGLVLQLRSGGEYSRLGIFSCSKYYFAGPGPDDTSSGGESDEYKTYAEWFESGVVKTITIV